MTRVGRIAATLLQLIRERELWLPDDDELLNELRNIRLRESSPGVVRLDHDRGQHDDRAAALSLAATAHLERPAVTPGRTMSALVDRRRDGSMVMRVPGRATATPVSWDAWS